MLRHPAAHGEVGGQGSGNGRARRRRATKRLLALFGGVVLAGILLGALATSSPADARPGTQAMPRQEGTDRDLEEPGDWADRCVIVDPEGDPPSSTQNPRDHGEVLIDGQSVPEGAVGFCRATDGGAWYRVEAPYALVSGLPMGLEEDQDCEVILRNRWEMPERISPPDQLDDFRGRGGSGTEPDYMELTYCREGNDWVQTGDDPFPYDQQDLCVTVLFFGDDAPADQISPLEEIDRHGELDPNNGLTVHESSETYCRDGDSWVREARDDDYPEGSFEDWSDECVTIIATGDTPRRTGQNPESLGEPLEDGDDDWADDPDLSRIDTSQFAYYCKHRDRDVWYLVENPPLDDLLPGYEISEADQGSCVVFTNVWNQEDLPEVLPEHANLYSYGQSMPRSAYEERYGAEYDLKELMCYTNGRWRRGDGLVEGCRGDMVLPQSGFLPAECWGRFPTVNYDIGYDSGAWNHFSRKAYGWWTGLFYDVGRTGTQISEFGVGWAYDFDISRYDQFGLNLGQNFDVNLVSNRAFDLFGITWLFFIAAAAFDILRGRASRAGGELLLHMVLLVVSGVLMTNRADYMHSIWNVMDRASSDVLVAGRGEDPADSDVSIGQVIDDIQAEIHRIFVELPYDYINWGHELSGDCATARDEILALGPHGDANFPREHMAAAGCQDERDYNHDPNGTRLMTSFVAMAASIVGFFTLTGVALTVVLGKFIALLLFAMAPFAFLMATMPGAGKRLFWLWCTTLGQSVAAVVGMAFVLAVLLLTMTEFFEVTDDVSMVERFGIMLLLLWIMEMARRRFLKAGQSTAGRWADNLSNWRPGERGGMGWQGPSGSQGIGFLAAQRGVDRTVGGLAASAARGTAVVGTMALGGIAGSIVAGYGRRASGRIALGNLRKMERYKEYRDGMASLPWSVGRLRRRGSGGSGGGSSAAPHVGGGGPGGGGGAPRSAGRSPAPTPGQLAVNAMRRDSPRRSQSRRDRHEARYWDSVAVAQNRYHRDINSGVDPSFARESYGTAVRRAGGRYNHATGRIAPMYPEPWSGVADPRAFNPSRLPGRGGWHRYGNEWRTRVGNREQALRLHDMNQGPDRGLIAYQDGRGHWWVREHSPSAPSNRVPTGSKLPNRRVENRRIPVQNREEGRELLDRGLGHRVVRDEHGRWWVLEQAEVPRKSRPPSGRRSPSGPSPSPSPSPGSGTGRHRREDPSPSGPSPSPGPGTGRHRREDPSPSGPSPSPGPGTGRHRREDPSPSRQGPPNPYRVPAGYVRREVGDEQEAMRLLNSGQARAAHMQNGRWYAEFPETSPSGSGTGRHRKPDPSSSSSRAAGPGPSPGTASHVRRDGDDALRARAEARATEILHRLRPDGSEKDPQWRAAHEESVRFFMNNPDHLSTGSRSPHVTPPGSPQSPAPSTDPRVAFSMPSGSRSVSGGPGPSSSVPPTPSGPPTARSPASGAAPGHTMREVKSESHGRDLLNRGQATGVFRRDGRWFVQMPDAPSSAGAPPMPSHAPPPPKPSESPLQLRAARAEAAGRGPEAAYWRGMERLGQEYRHEVAGARRDQLPWIQGRYNLRLHDLRQGYHGATGEEPPSYRPW